ncbi:MAG: excinuclease ABC subunit UvrC [Candidatus Poribacteria bacterium]|nr:excinuclease ABC subunit UvrC [Candidatus Poribacteria bacterium]
MKSEQLSNTTPELWHSLPNVPGVYLMKASDGTVIYVGKAVRLRSRVRSYFSVQLANRKLADKSGEKSVHALTSQMIRYVTEIDYIVTETEVEALILENNLIKAHQPRYNVKLKDDKRYPYLRVTVNEPFPRIHITRRAENDGARYFGPYVHVRSTRHILKQLTKLFPIRTCTLPLKEKGNKYRACLDYHIGRCPGPCADKMDVRDYAEIVRKVCQFLGGNTDAVVKELTVQMEAAAEALDFETAAKYRDTLKDVQQAITTQSLDSVSAADEDVIGIAARTDIACVQLLRVRDGKLLEREHYYLNDADPKSLATALSAFISQYYQNAVFVPKTIVLPMPIEGAELIEAWLSEKRGNRVALHVPRAGRLRKLQALASKNAEILLTQREQNVVYGSGVDPALVELQELLGLSHPVRRIEAYDISNLGDRFAVGSMVVLEDGKPASGEYRRFKIRTVKGQNDFAMMQEVITRRFRRALADDEKFNKLPDLMLIDGGKGQLSAAQKAMNFCRSLRGKTCYSKDAASSLPDIPMIALAKRIEEIFVPGKSESIVLRKDNPTLHTIQRLRDEAHRFAVTYHRRLRQKSLSVSVLDEIPNLGPKRKQALLQHFGSIEAIREASLDGLLSVKGIPRSVAENIRKHL